MFCTTCGKELRDGAKFCVHCGARVVGDAEDAIGAAGQARTNAKQAVASGEAVPNEKAALTEEPEYASLDAQMDSAKKRSKRRGMPTVVLVALVMLLLSGLAFAAYTAYRYYVENVSTPIDTVEEFTQAVSDADLDSAVACLDPDVQETYSETLGTVDTALNALGFSVGSGTAEAWLEGFVESLFPTLSEWSGTELTYSIVLIDEVQVIDGDAATVTGTWRCEAWYGDEHETADSPICFNLKLEWGTWYIQYDDDFERSLG